MPNDLADLITSREACAILGIDRSTLTRRVAAGKLPAVRVPGYKGALLFDPAEVKRHAQETAA